MFDDRRDAGRQLVQALQPYRADHPVVLGLPRGGVAVAFEVARGLATPLDVLVVGKLSALGLLELGIGAVVDGDHSQAIVDERAMKRLGVPAAYLDGQVARELTEVRRRNAMLRAGRPPVELRDRTVIVVDDGIATGGTVRAALRGVHRAQPRRVVLAVPVAPPPVAAALRGEADAVVCLETPRHFGAVGQFYRDFRRATDGEVIDLLVRAAADRADPIPATANGG